MSGKSMKAIEVTVGEKIYSIEMLKKF